MIHKIEAQGVKSGSVKHIRYPPIIVDCGLVVQEQEEDKVEVKVDESKSCDNCAKDYAAVSGWFWEIKCRKESYFTKLIENYNKD